MLTGELMMIKTFAVIPARSGSKGVPKKNSRSVGSRSLLERALDSATNSAIDCILVSTDDEEMRQVALGRGAICPKLRAETLSDDHASSVEVAIDAIKMISTLTDLRLASDARMVWLEPTSPFRTSLHVCEAVSLYDELGCRTLVSVCSLERKPENIFRKNGAELIRYIESPAENYSRRQDMKSLCRINSAIYIVPIETMLAEESFVREPLGFYQMNNLDSLNIDTELDLKFANFLASEHFKDME